MKIRNGNLHWIAAFAALLAGCNHDTSGKAALREAADAFVPPDAAARVVAPDLPWVQITFNVRRPWLEFAVNEKRINQAKVEGWRLCRPTSAEWDGYEDHAVTPPIYRRLRTYVLYKDGILLQLFGIYDKPLETMGLGKRDDEPVQQGIVLASKSTAKEALQMAENFQLSCDMPAQDDGR
jgi:hypothetical protein